MNFPRLFSPVKINSLVSRNRIVASPIGNIFEEKALGGAGIVICGHTIVEPGRSSFAGPAEPSVFHKYSVEEARSRIRRCHQSGAKASLELFHAGQYARVEDFAVGPITLKREDGIEVRALDAAGMENIADLFALAAANAKELGFDMVFLHFGHGWLPAQFLSPLFNKRTDEFGGSIENRSKFPLRILEKVRQAVGAYYPVDMRVSAVEWVPDSITFEDTLEFIKKAEAYIDTVQISAGLDINHEGNVHMVTTNFKERMVNREYARIVHREVQIPVSVVGAVLNPADAEELITSGDADLVAFGRSFIADPDWPNKAKDGMEEDITPCIRCMHCYHISTNRRNVGCSVNPRFTNETFIKKHPGRAEKEKFVVVVGGGPAGLMAAITARQRGHRVILFEKNSFLGGALHYVAMEHYKEDIRAYLEYLLRKVHAGGAEIRLSTEVTPELVRNLGPDSLFVAVGARPIEPAIPGMDLPQVVDFYHAIQQGEFLGQKVAIIGGGTIGAEIALELSELYGKEVYLVEMTGEIAAQGNMLYRIALRQKMDAVPNLVRLLHTKCVEITPNAVILEHDGKETRRIPVDNTIIAAGVIARHTEAEAFYGITPDTFSIGDCNRPGKIMEAIFEGYAIASRL
jgi:2,4-dienoyl-CoA reductase-like NADH-dependent reductase (Old Yellow Enzyme family)/thioredoxin reductase